MKHEFCQPRVDCDCNARIAKDPDAQLCPVCEWGASICKICGQVEGELTAECPGNKDWRKKDD